MTFGELLTALLEAKKVNKKKFCEKLEIDRTMLYRYLSNKAPVPPEILDKIIDELMLTITEKSMLQEAYETSIIGQDIYQCRSSLDTMFKSTNYNYNHYVSTASVFPDENYITQTIGKPLCFIQGNGNIKMVIEHIFQRLRKDDAPGDIYIFSQPSFDFLMDKIYALLKTRKAVKIHHIFRLMQSPTLDMMTPFSENLKLHKKVLPLCFPIDERCLRYFPAYYYDTLPNGKKNFVLTFPNQLVTESFALIATEDLSNGIYFSDKNIVSQFEKKIKQMYNQMTPYFKTVDLTGKISIAHLARINFLSEFNISPEPKSKFVIGEIFQSNKILPLEQFSHVLIEGLKAKSQASLKKGYPIYMFFTKKGLEDFIETGIISDVGEKMAPLDTKQRMRYLKSILDLSQSYDNVFPALLDDNNFFSAHNINLHIFKDSTVIFTNDDLQSSSAIFMFEKSFVSIFSDYFFNVYAKSFSLENKKNAIALLAQKIENMEE